MAKNKGLIKLLTILGGILAIINGILSLLGLGISYWGILGNIVDGIIWIVLGIIVFFTGYKPGKILPLNGVVLLVLAIILLVFGELIGGILLIIAAILEFL